MMHRRVVANGNSASGTNLEPVARFVHTLQSCTLVRRSSWLSRFQDTGRAGREPGTDRLGSHDKAEIRGEAVLVGLDPALPALPADAALPSHLGPS